MIPFLFGLWDGREATQIGASLMVASGVALWGFIAGYEYGSGRLKLERRKYAP